MKKIIALVLAGVMMVGSLTACKGGVGKSSKYLLDIKYSKHVKLCDYKGVEATKVVYDVTDEDVMEEIEYGLYDYATYDPVTNRGVEVGDYATITYTTTIDGQVNEDFSGEDEEILVGEGYLYPELEDALVGMKASEEKEVKVTMTEDFADEGLVGKEATVQVTVKSISVENLPEYNLDFVKENTEFDTMEEYEASVKESLKTSKEEEYKYLAVEEIFAYLSDNSEFDGYPEELYTKCEKLYNESNEYYASMYGMELEEFLEMFGIDEAAKKEEIIASVNFELVVGAIAQEEGIDCTEKEVKEYVEEVYLDYGYDSAEAFLEDYSEEEIGGELIYQKVSDFLYENAKFVEISEEEYLAQEEAMYDETEGEESEEETTAHSLEDAIDAEIEKFDEDTTEE
ncbi:MAG: trigger factor [Lachnospiraceae bacterium]|nr:trigger factor [Lachnospiraceae bacterium]